MPAGVSRWTAHVNGYNNEPVPPVLPDEPFRSQLVILPDIAIRLVKQLLIGVQLVLEQSPA